MDNTIEKRIKAAKLTKTSRLIATYLMENKTKISFMTASDIANALGVSDTSVIRTTRALGYRGFSELQKDVQSTLMKYMENDGAVFMTQEERIVKRTGLLTENNIIDNAMAATLRNLKVINSKDMLQKIETASEIILNSEKRYIVGCRMSSIVGKYLSSSVGHLLSNTIQVDVTEVVAIPAMLNITEKDCLVLISFPRHPKMVYTILDIARHKNAKIIIISENFANQIISYSDVYISLNVDGISFYHSYVPPLLVAEILSANVGRLIGMENISDRMNQIEKYTIQSDLLEQNIYKKL